MAKKKADKPPIDPDRAEEIRVSARSGENWASQVGYGPACTCGAFKEGSTVTSWGVEVQKGRCERHGITRGSRVLRDREGR